MLRNELIDFICLKVQKTLLTQYEIDLKDAEDNIVYSDIYEYYEKERNNKLMLSIAMDDLNLDAVRNNGEFRMRFDYINKNIIVDKKNGNGWDEGVNSQSYVTDIAVVAMEKSFEYIGDLGV